MFTVPGIVQSAFPSLVWNIKSDERKIYLTFDDGPVKGVTEWVLKQLTEFEARATFFCVGENVDRYPELIRLIKESGHSVGNHTYNHVNGWKVSKKEYLENVEKCDVVLNNHNVETTLFRPPYGRINPLLIGRVQSDHRIIMWDLLSKDYSSRYSPDYLINKLVKHTHAGSVVVFHDSLKAEKNLRYILPKYLSFLKEKGYRMESIAN